MSDINLTFSRGLLRLVHEEVRKAFPQIRNVMTAASVTGSPRNGWFVQIIIPKVEPFNYDCRGYNAYEARYKAWHAFLRHHRRVA